MTNNEHNAQAQYEHQKNDRKEYARQNFALESRFGVRSGYDLDTPTREGVVAAISSAFGEAPGDTAEHLQGDIFLIARDKKGLVSGFSALDFGQPSTRFAQTSDLEQLGGYLSAVAVQKEHQHQGLHQLFTEAHLQSVLASKLPLLYTRTQSPAVERGLRTELQAAQKHGQLFSFAVERRVVPGCYGQQLSQNLPRVHDHETQAAYDRLQIANGDAYIVIFHLMYEPKGLR